MSYGPPSFWASLKPQSTGRSNHWEFPYIMSVLDSRTPNGGMYNWLHKVSGGRCYDTAVSLGCGNGLKEMALVEFGIAKRVLCCDIDRNRCSKATEAVKVKGLQDKVTVVCADAVDFMKTNKLRFDMVHWDNSLHHMSDVYAAVKWSWDVLTPGGCFYMMEYVGTDRFQWTKAELDIANRMRATFPQHWFLGKNNTWCKSRLMTPPPQSMVPADEAPASSSIAAAVATTIPTAVYKPAGGLGYYVSMSGMWSSVEDTDNSALDAMMATDAVLADYGMSSYANSIAIKP